MADPQTQWAAGERPQAAGATSACPKAQKPEDARACPKAQKHEEALPPGKLHGFGREEGRERDKHGEQEKA